MVPPPLVDMQKQPKLDLQTIQPQFQAPTSPTTTQSNVEPSGEQDQTNFVSTLLISSLICSHVRLAEVAMAHLSNIQL